MQRQFTHTFTLPVPVDQAIQFFTPKAEEHWVDAWHPKYIHPEDGSTCERMVFITEDERGVVYWSCSRWCPQVGEAEYVRVSPHYQTSHVVIKCEPSRDDRSRVQVDYNISPLSEEGRGDMMAMTSNDFVSRIATWPGKIADHIY